MLILLKKYFWFLLAAVVVIFLYKKNAVGNTFTPGRTLGATGDSQASGLMPAPAASVDTAPAWTTELTVALAPYKEAASRLAGNLSIVSPTKTAELNDYANQATAVKNIFQAVNI